MVAWDPCRRVGGTHCARSVPTGQAHPLQPESTVWGVNRSVSLRRGFLLSSVSFWGQEWLSGPMGSRSASDIDVPVTSVGAQSPSGQGAHLLPFHTHPVRGQSHLLWKHSHSAPPGPPIPAGRGKLPAARSSRRLHRLPCPTQHAQLCPPSLSPNALQ